MSKKDTLSKKPHHKSKKVPYQRILKRILKALYQEFTQNTLKLHHKSKKVPYQGT